MSRLMCKKRAIQFIIVQQCFFLIICCYNRGCQEREGFIAILLAVIYVMVLQKLASGLHPFPFNSLCACFKLSR